ncbi:MAG: hypothetical protein OEX21_14350 [Betaproteobacteria bacterium]|nr:hypothetical protein [Betaproteobacteria bacterium]
MAALLRKPEYFWPVLWGALAIAMAGVLALEFAFGDVGAGNGPRAPAKVVDAKMLPPFTLPPEAQAGTETVARPLFVPGRRPAPPAASAESGVMRKGLFVLQGTTMVGDLSFAMLKEVSTGKTHRVQKGGKVLDMTLSDVGPNFAVLALGGDSETIPLLVARSSGASAQAHAAAAAAAGPFTASRPAAAQPTAPASATASPASRPMVTTPVPVPAGARRDPSLDPTTMVLPTSRPPSELVDPASQSQPSSASPSQSAEEALARRRAARRGQGTN